MSVRNSLLLYFNKGSLKDSGVIDLIEKLGNGIIWNNRYSGGEIFFHQLSLWKCSVDYNICEERYLSVRWSKSQKGRRKKEEGYQEH